MRSRATGIMLAFMIAMVSFPANSIGVPSVLPTGLLVGNPSAYQGLSVFAAQYLNKVLVIDMDGKVFHEWTIPRVSYHVKPLPNGHILVGVSTKRFYADTLREYDWNGNVAWEFHLPAEFFKLHHDFHRLADGNTYILAARMRYVPTFNRQVEDDVILKVNPSGKVVWKWSTIDHFNDLWISKRGRTLIANTKDLTDVTHTNSIQPLPPNKFELSDNRLRSGNILVSQRNTNIVFLINEYGDIVWQYSNDNIGQHHVSMIPPTLGGEGNIIMFDNGGYGGYPAEQRSYSKVSEINPITEKDVWSYSARQNGKALELFFSMFKGSAQRLPNGNTLAVESAFGRIFEMDPQYNIVWEYVNPGFGINKSHQYTNEMYRAYRVDYSWPTGQVLGADHFYW